MTIRSASVLAFAVLLAACSESSTNTGSTSSSSGSTSSSSSGGTSSSSSGNTSSSSSSGDSGSTLNGCTSFKDETNAVNAQGVAITWDLTIAQSDMRCITVKVGTDVTFEGNFTAHPIAPQGGDTPTPFTDAVANVANPGTAEERTTMKFDKAGSFGFVCTFHSNMKGVIQVIP